jgi:hypothetical protein
MNVQIQISVVEAIQSELEAINLEITSTQSIANLIDLGGRLSAHLAFTGQQMAIAKKVWRKEVSKAYDSFVFSRMSQGLTVPPSMAKDYVQARAGDQEGTYEFIERVHRSCTHIIDFLRSCISALKEEQKVFTASGFNIP